MMQDTGKRRYTEKELSDVNDGSDSEHLSLDQGIPDLLLFMHTGTPPSPKQAHEAYVVFNGRRVGVFMSWTDVKRSISMLDNAIYAGFTLKEAQRTWNTRIATDPRLLAAARHQVKEDSRTRVLSAAFASMSTPSTPKRACPPLRHPTTPITTPSSGAPTTCTHNDFYVVQYGSKPGVYCGSYASWEAAGPSADAKRFVASSEEAAWKLFGQLVMKGDITYL